MVESITPNITHPNVQSAYGAGGANQAQPTRAPGDQQKVAGPSFEQFIEGAYESAKSNLEDGQQAMMRAATGEADVQSVVEDVTQAQVTVKSVVAMRDKAVQAYKRILQMPI